MKCEFCGYDFEDGEYLDAHLNHGQEIFPHQDYEVVELKTGEYGIALNIAGKPFTQAYEGFVEVLRDTPIIRFYQNKPQFYQIDFDAATTEPDPETGGFAFMSSPEYACKDDYYKSLPYMDSLALAAWYFYKSHEQMEMARLKYNRYLADRKKEI